MLLEQCLPFTVLKPSTSLAEENFSTGVGTVLTVYGIETVPMMLLWLYIKLEQCLPFTVLKLDGDIIEFINGKSTVGTVLTVYGIETGTKESIAQPVFVSWNSAYRLRY